jgi:uncharacterized membrane protein YphA (DoxX/SURF4 family)
MKNIALNFCRVFVGLLFIASGLIKANDPMGFGYKLQEYFDVFHIPFLGDFATGIAMLLCIVEIVLGALLLCGFWPKRVTMALLVTIIFFTFLTFVSAFFKVVTSCGCFGDAIPLTPWQSFGKDVVLLLMIVYLYLQRDRISALTSSAALRTAILVCVTVLSLGFTLYTYYALPIVDFLPYKVGNNVPVLMKLPAGQKGDEYEILYQLKHKSTGETKSMNDKLYLKSGIWEDDNWEIVGDPERRLVKKGYDIKIKDLNISDASGTDYTKELIENPYYNLVVVAYDLRKTDTAAFGRINALALKAAEAFNVRTVMLTSNAAQDAQSFSERNKLFIEIFYADAVPLKSMVRSSPGLLLFKNGVVVDKWSAAFLPDFETLNEKYLSR